MLYNCFTKSYLPQIYLEWGNHPGLEMLDLWGKKLKESDEGPPTLPTPSTFGKIPSSRQTFAIYCPEFELPAVATQIFDIHQGGLLGRRWGIHRVTRVRMLIEARSSKFQDLLGTVPDTGTTLDAIHISELPFFIKLIVYVQLHGADSSALATFQACIWINQRHHRLTLVGVFAQHHVVHPMHGNLHGSHRTNVAKSPGTKEDSHSNDHGHRDEPHPGADHGNLFPKLGPFKVFTGSTSHDHPGNEEGDEHCKDQHAKPRMFDHLRDLAHHIWRTPDERQSEELLVEHPQGAVHQGSAITEVAAPLSTTEESQDRESQHDGHDHQPKPGPKDAAICHRQCKCPVNSSQPGDMAIVLTVERGCFAK